MCLACLVRLGEVEEGRELAHLSWGKAARQHGVVQWERETRCGGGTWGENWSIREAAGGFKKGRKRRPVVEARRRSRTGTGVVARMAS